MSASASAVQYCGKWPCISASASAVLCYGSLTDLAEQEVWVNVVLHQVCTA